MTSSLGRPFKSLPVYARSAAHSNDATEGAKSLLGPTRTDPLPGTAAGQTRLPELAEQIANTEVQDPGYALRRLRTFNNVKDTLARVATLQDEKKTFVEKVAIQLKTTFLGAPPSKPQIAERISEEVRIIAFSSLPELLECFWKLRVTGNALKLFVSACTNSCSKEFSGYHQFTRERQLS